MTVAEITPDTVNNDNSRYIIIDVREEEEYNAELGHIDNSQLITLGEELSNWIEKNKAALKDKEVVFVCRSGGRSGRATEEALSHGFTRAYNMKGGMLNWNELKLPVAKNWILILILLLNLNFNI